MDPWCQEGQWMGSPHIETMQLYSQSMNGRTLASTANLDGPMALATSPDMQCLHGFPSPVSTHPHPAMFQSVQLPPLVGHQYTGDGSATQLHLPYTSTGSRVRHWALPDLGYWPTSAGIPEPQSWRTYGHSGTKHIQPASAGQPSSRPQEMLAVPRGPPQKPKRSGYALWVGNLAPSISIVRAKDYFSRRATQDIESVFLMSRSNCAFVNYRTQKACRAAQTRFHGSQLDGKHLVCRIRWDAPCNSDGSASPLHHAPVNTHGVQEACPSEFAKVETMPVIVGTSSTSSGSSTTSSQASPGTKPKVPEKFIILKSLSAADLEASVRQGTWTTQLKNEAVLEKAFDDSDKVYLIFSANKSGEYFGYAQLLRPMPFEYNEVSIGTAPEAVGDAYFPTSISTPATSAAPKGRIVDDSARGTLFWETVYSDDENDDQMVQAKSESDSKRDRGVRVFAIEWLSTARVPFYRTRGLRNPWNKNQEVKVARDGTEVEPSIGRRLLTLFASV